MTESKVNALTYTPPAVEINNVKYARRRLGIMDELALVDLIFKSGAKLNIDKAGLANMEASEIAGHLFSLLTVALDDLLSFLGSVLVDFPLSVDDMKDPDQFPLGSLEAIVESIAEDEDVLAFFTHVKKLLKLKEKFTSPSASRNKSTSSKKKQGGQTKKS